MAPFLIKKKPAAKPAEFRLGRIALRRGSVEAHLRPTRGVDSIAIGDITTSISGLSTGVGGASLTLDTLGARVRLPGGPSEGLTLATAGRLTRDELGAGAGSTWTATARASEGRRGFRSRRSARAASTA